MRGGDLQQFGTPAEIYKRPANGFVAGFHRHAGDDPARCGTALERRPRQRRGSGSSPSRSPSDESRTDEAASAQDQARRPAGGRPPRRRRLSLGGQGRRADRPRKHRALRPSPAQPSPRAFPPIRRFKPARPFTSTSARHSSTCSTPPPACDCRRATRKDARDAAPSPPTATVGDFHALCLHVSTFRRFAREQRQHRLGGRFPRVDDAVRQGRQDRREGLRRQRRPPDRRRRGRFRGGRLHRRVLGAVA